MIFEITKGTGFKLRSKDFIRESVNPWKCMHNIGIVYWWLFLEPLTSLLLQQAIWLGPVISRLCCTFESFEELLKIPVPRSQPTPIKSECWGWERGIRSFWRSPANATVQQKFGDHCPRLTFFFYRWANRVCLCGPGNSLDVLIGQGPGSC